MTQAVNLANFANSLNSSGQMDPAALSSAVPVSKGGTGATSLTSGSLLKGNGTSAISPATAANIVAAIGSTAVQNATSLTTTNFTVEEVAGSLVFKYGAAVIFAIDSSGNVQAAGNITAYYGS